MSNIATALKEEITRIARKMMRGEIDALKKTNSRYRNEIANLKRHIADMERQLKALQKQSGQSKKVAADTGSEERQVRFSTAGLKKFRERHGLSAASLGAILDVSLQTIYNWEAGKTRPSKGQIAKIAVLRKMGKRDIQQRLELMHNSK